jgi:hypothetical protein
VRSGKVREGHINSGYIRLYKLRSSSDNLFRLGQVNSD